MATSPNRARIAELDAAIAAREADGDENHPDLTGARDWHSPESFSALAYFAGADFHAPCDEQSDHFIAWLEAYEAEAQRDLSRNNQHKDAA